MEAPRIINSCGYCFGILSLIHNIIVFHNIEISNTYSLLSNKETCAE